ncbi:MAG: DUF262 domain-containing protein [Prevotella sp.]|jgi:uncharacterized protein with ParB-like and HNH nuclease domain|nr:DUF262 domain-containing protein [Prevotella sp.]MCH3992357.1 DUF262 domain-containing protein [Prevotella sp.]MCI1473063.1 DUF262 domain-containing protein [Prevotella sp.]MCI1519391.1 DUF262 domain-containing protein [Prevotella sp.]MCI1548750.1 DUF262 domain-containing protein [Prevotella sp.]MCI1595031.1 DUF262 domain-containing protein [Prevotella sp.]
MKTGRYNLSQLLASPEVGQIIIPELQRDYVWEKRNVQGLMNSILSRYQEKTTVTLKIEEEKKNVPNSIKQYLERQYSRLRYNVRIGFIYAYHSVDELDKYYLIDGQQRITTLFLSLLVAYKKAQRANDFRRLYFVNNLPKLDYKVRDISHQFLVSLIDYELSPQSKSFDQSKFFHQAYSHDKSAATLWNNYQLITSILKNEKDYNSLIDYLENYIEFNYFDTNMSYQGERLYLYMNSRGETLSSHEIIKAVMVERSDDKLKASTLWEDWQDFFWRNRDCNRNADKGFAEFIKWSVILHMNCHEKEKKSDTHKLKEPINKSSNISQSVQEVKEDYIKIFFDSEDDLRQQKWIKQYILDNPSFDISWMAEHMKALKKLSIQTKLAFPPIGFQKLIMS